MLDLLRKIGVPATIAAVVATLVTVVPLLFTVDERYAKASELKAEIAKLEEANADLRKELAQAVGYQQAMVALLQQGRLPQPQPTSFLENFGPLNIIRVQLSSPRASTPASAASSASASAAASPVVRAPILIRPAATAPSTSQAPRIIEKPKNWQELQEGLYRQQQRLTKD